MAAENEVGGAATAKDDSMLESIEQAPSEPSGPGVAQVLVPALTPATETITQPTATGQIAEVPETVGPATVAPTVAPTVTTETIASIPAPGPVVQTAETGALIHAPGPVAPTVATETITGPFVPIAATETGALIPAPGPVAPTVATETGALIPASGPFAPTVATETGALIPAPQTVAPTSATETGALIPAPETIARTAATGTPAPGPVAPTRQVPQPALPPASTTVHAPLPSTDAFSVPAAAPAPISAPTTMQTTPLVQVSSNALVLPPAPASAHALQEHTRTPGSTISSVQINKDSKPPEQPSQPAATPQQVAGAPSIVAVQSRPVSQVVHLVDGSSQSVSSSSKVSNLQTCPPAVLSQPGISRAPVQHLPAPLPQATATFQGSTARAPHQSTATFQVKLSQAGVTSPATGMPHQATPNPAAPQLVSSRSTLPQQPAQSQSAPQQNVAPLQVQQVTVSAASLPKVGVPQPLSTSAAQTVVPRPTPTSSYQTETLQVVYSSTSQPIGVTKTGVTIPAQQTAALNASATSPQSGVPNYSAHTVVSQALEPLPPLPPHPHHPVGITPVQQAPASTSGPPPVAAHPSGAPSPATSATHTPGYIQMGTTVAPRPSPSVVSGNQPQQSYSAQPASAPTKTFPPVQQPQAVQQAQAVTSVPTQHHPSQVIASSQTAPTQCRAPAPAPSSATAQQFNPSPAPQQQATVQQVAVPRPPNTDINRPPQPTLAQAKPTAPVANPSAPAPTPAKAGTQAQLQQQIQQQLQAQLQAQLFAAASRGQANITPEQIQAQAQAMVQAAAQAQAVVAATKARGDLIPMSSQEISTLSQKQAKAIVNARQQSTGTTLSESEVKSQVQLQAQALVHAHTQAQIQAGIYKDGENASSGAKRPAPSASKPAAVSSTSMSSQATKKQRLASAPGQFKISDAQMQKQNNLTKSQSVQRAELQKKQRAELAAMRAQFAKDNPENQLTAEQAAKLNAATQRHNQERDEQTHQFRQQMAQLQDSFRRDEQQPNQNTNPTPNLVLSSTSVTAGSSIPGTLPAPPNVEGAPLVFAGATPAVASPGTMMQAGVPTTSPADQPDSAEFLQHLKSQLTSFWKQQLADMQQLPVGTEHDFKNHNDLPLARIKRIMKSDEDVRMISAEAPVLFAKACEMFILELTLRSWNYSESNKRRTLQKEDIQTAIKKTDIFDFLVDVIN